MSKFLNIAAGAAFGLAVLSPSIPAQAAPIVQGACCNLILGCCPPNGACRLDTSSGCNGIADTYKGNGSTCDAQCPVTTTTTLEPTGACCLSGGGCSTESEATCKELGAYQGDGTDCGTSECTAVTTTTLPEIPTGACCAAGGGCDQVTEAMCDGTGGSYQGDSTLCAFVECTQPTTTLPDTTTTTYNPTTTVPDTTTTTEAPIVPLCGDANNDKSITAADALIALKASVGSVPCSIYVCDYNGSDQVTTSDALAILKVAVGQVVIPMCPLDI